MEYIHFTKAPIAILHISPFVKFIYYRYRYKVVKLFILGRSHYTVGKYFFLHFYTLIAQKIFYLTFVYHSKIYILCQITVTSTAGHFQYLQSLIKAP
jgi:hypothetical protein